MNVASTIHLGRDEKLEWTLLADGEPAHTIVDQVTRMQIVLDHTTTYDSASQPALFDWTLGNGRITIELAKQAITPGHYWAELFVFDADHPDGFVWGEPKALVFI